MELHRLQHHGIADGVVKYIIAYGGRYPILHRHVEALIANEEVVIAITALDPRFPFGVATWARTIMTHDNEFVSYSSGNATGL